MSRIKMDGNRLEKNLEDESFNLHKQRRETSGFSFSRDLQTFSSESSVGGLKYAVNSNANGIRRAIWAILVIGGLTFATYQIVQQVKYYLSDPTSVSIDISDEDLLPFPMVTVCNINQMSKRKVLQLDPSGNLSRAVSILFPPLPFWPDPSLVPWAISQLLLNTSTNWGDLARSMYVDIEQQIVYCTFDSLPCEEWDQSIVFTDNGYCFTFNKNGNKTAREIGSSNGLRLILNADQTDYFTPVSPATGFRVLLQPHTDIPTVRTRGINTNINQETDFILSHKKVLNLPHPYGNCSDDDNYVYAQCTMECELNYTMAQCGCTHEYHPGDTCDPLTAVKCLQPAMTNYTTQKILSTQCDCPPQCEQDFYRFTLTSSDLSEYFVDWVEEGFGFTEEATRRDIAILNFYYTNKQTETVETKRAYSLLSLLCDIGGALGLILGSTILTAVEFIDFIIVAVWNLCTVRNMPAKRVHVSAANQGDKTNTIS